MEKFSFILLVVYASAVRIIHGQTAYDPTFEYQHGVLTSIVNLEEKNSQKDAEISSLLKTLEAAIHTIEELNTTVQVLKSHDFSSGSTYIRWGRQACPDGDSAKVYDGWAGGSYHSQSGNGANLLCLPKDPIFGDGNDNTESISLIYGTEYEFGGRLHDQEVPCSVCRIPRTNNMMLPARNECYPGWKLEYHGYLAGPHYTHYRSDYVCLDDMFEATENSVSSNKNGALLYYVEARCGSLPCDTYPSGRGLTCAVCSYSPLTNQKSIQPYV